MLWQLPQIVIISAAEVLYAITGLEFSFTQVRKLLKRYTFYPQFIFDIMMNLKLGSSKYEISIIFDLAVDNSNWEFVCGDNF